MLFLKALLACLTAASMAWVELVTSKYPRTIGLFWNRSWALWCYAAVYGLIAFGFTLAYSSLASAGVLDFHGPLASAAAGVSRSAGAHDAPATHEALPTILIAIMIGVSAKALLHIRLFSIPTAGTQQTFPVGTETIVQLFQPWLLQTIVIDEFNAISGYLDAKALAYPELVQVRERITTHLPGSLPAPERTAMERDIDRATSVRVAFEIYLRAFGATTLDQLFP